MEADSGAVIVMWAQFYKASPAAHRQPEEGRMTLIRLIRQCHRWLAILFTLTVIANFAAMTRGQPPAWITYSPLPPLFLMMFSGLYMFFLPYVAKRRGAAEP
jgi:hypothetical protein